MFGEVLKYYSQMVTVTLTLCLQVFPYKIILNFLLNFRLGLKDQQEREIVHVILYCCLQEKTFNPFYAFLANKFCGHERRFQVKTNLLLHWFCVMAVVRKRFTEYLRVGACLLGS